MPPTPTAVTQIEFMIFHILDKFYLYKILRAILWMLAGPHGSLSIVSMVMFHLMLLVVPGHYQDRVHEATKVGCRYIIQKHEHANISLA